MRNRIVAAVLAVLFMGGMLAVAAPASAAVHHPLTCSNEYFGSIDPPNASGEVHWVCNGNPLVQVLQGRVRCLHLGSPYFNYGPMVTVVNDLSQAACDTGDTPKGLQVRFTHDNGDGGWGPWFVYITFP